MGETYFYIEYRFSGISIFGSTGLFDCSPVSDGTLSRLSPAQLTWKAAQPPGVKKMMGGSGWLVYGLPTVWTARVWTACWA